MHDEEPVPPDPPEPLSAEMNSHSESISAMEK
jgi:hypothetical protein